MSESATATETLAPWTILEDALRLANDPRRSRVAVVLHGGPGSGKTWVRERMSFRPGELAVVIDQDREREDTPRLDVDGNREDDASYSARLRDISRERMEWAIGRGAPLYIEGLSCRPERTILVLAALRDAGYHVVLVGLDCERALAWARLRAREAEDGRRVDDEIVDAAYRAIPASWARFRQLAHEFALFDTSGDDPIPIACPGLAPTDPPRSLREAIGSMLPKPYAELADLAVRLSDAVGRARK